MSRVDRPGVAFVHLTACDHCGAQYDVTTYAEKQLRCRCGHLVAVAAPAPVSRVTVRCGTCGGPLTQTADRCPFCHCEISSAAVDLSILCPHCCAANARRSRFCRGCGVELKAETLSARVSPRRCPVCAEPMLTRGFGPAVVDECRTCHGLWASPEAFATPVQRAIDAANGSTVPSVAPELPSDLVVVYRRCPDCSALMHRRNFERVSGVIVDECRAHGIWMDPNELELMARFIRSRTTASLTSA